MSTLDQDRHIKKALKDEIIFPLMARDASAPMIIAEWIKQNLFSQPPDKLHEALDCAIKMANEHEQIRLEVEKKKASEKEFKIGEDF
jgi:macrodomain Ter protein organizer (MatP/YcbG family)